MKYRMLINSWRKEYGLDFHTENCCSFLPQQKIYKGNFPLSDQDLRLIKIFLMYLFCVVLAG